MRERVFKGDHGYLRVEEHARCVLVAWGEGDLSEIVNDLFLQVHDYYGNRRYIVYGRRGWVKALAPLGYEYRGHVKPGKFGYALVRAPDGAKRGGLPQCDAGALRRRSVCALDPQGRRSGCD